VIGAEHVVAKPVSGLAPVVSGTVELDRKHRLGAVEVDDVAKQHELR